MVLHRIARDEQARVFRRWRGERRPLLAFYTLVFDAALKPVPAVPTVPQPPLFVQVAEQMHLWSDMLDPLPEQLRAAPAMLAELHSVEDTSGWAVCQEYVRVLRDAVEALIWQMGRSETSLSVPCDSLRRGVVGVRC